MSEKNYLCDQSSREKHKAALKRTRIFLNTVMFFCAAVAIASLIAMLVVVIMLSVGERSDEKDGLLTVLACSFASGAALFALLSYLFGRLVQRALYNELDFRERCDGENSFFVGEGTIATFLQSALLIHDELGKKREEIRVPYAEIRLFSVCTRRRPREKGEWSVVIEIPVKYLAKEGKAGKNDPPALVQTDGKERLYACIEKSGLRLLGERPPRGAKREDKKFSRVKQYGLPDAQKRKRALMLSALGVAVIVAGALVGIFFNISLGAVLGVFGIFVAARALFAYVRAKATLAFYKEGMFWRESGRTESSFLKWEEIERVSLTQKDGMPLLKVHCIYGDYHFPAAGGAYGFLEENFPEKCV